MALDKKALALDVLKWLESVGFDIKKLSKERLGALLREETEIAELVARAMAGSMAEHVLKAVEKAVGEGEIPEEWGNPLRKRLPEIMRGPLVSTGLGQFDPRLTFQATLRSAYAAGRYDRFKRAGYTHMLYRTMRDERVRDAHRNLNGTVLPIDDDWWGIHMPPNDPRCRCKGIPVNRRDIDRLEARGIELQKTPPEEETATYRNALGEELTLPVSIAPNWRFHASKRREALAETIAVRTGSLENGAYLWKRISGAPQAAD